MCAGVVCNPWSYCHAETHQCLRAPRNPIFMEILNASVYYCESLNVNLQMKQMKSVLVAPRFVTQARLVRAINASRRPLVSNLWIILFCNHDS
eukprot:UN24466